MPHSIMLAPEQIMLLFLGAAALLVILHTLAWRTIRLLGDFIARLPAHAAPRFWAASPFRRLASAPSSVVLRRASSATKPETLQWPATHLIGRGALYVAALLGGLVEEVIEGQEILRLDRAVNAYFAPFDGEVAAQTPIRLSVATEALNVLVPENFADIDE